MDRNTISISHNIKYITDMYVSEFHIMKDERPVSSKVKLMFRSA